MESIKREFEPNLSFEEYKAYYRDRFEIKRENGIIEVKMHTNGGVSTWEMTRHSEWADVLTAVGNDTENEVLILTAAGDKFKSGMDPEFMKFVAKKMQDGSMQSLLFDMVQVQNRFYQALVWNVDIPTISAINGPGGEGGHMEFALLSDYRICAPDVVFSDPHFLMDQVPGGGAFLVLQNTIGPMRANYYAYTGAEINADKALDWGLVDEIAEREALLTRAWEIAREIIKKPRAVRRLTHEIMRRPLRRMLNADLNMHTAMNAWGGSIMVAQMSAEE